MSISDNISHIRLQIQESLVKVNRPTDSVCLIAVTKTVPVEYIREAIDAGIQDIGENRIQEAKGKFPQLDRKIHWHLIGHLQTNKVKHAVEMFDLIHSVDRMELAIEINKRAGNLGKIQSILVQVNTSGEDSKSGCQPIDTNSLINQMAPMPNLKIEGLMTIGPLTEDKTKIRRSFIDLKQISCRIMEQKIPNVNMNHLSMGMSSDFSIAIEEGSTMVRVGTAIFGVRK